MNPAPVWDAYATFLAVMRGGSLSAAARTMRLAQPTVRRQIEALEASLGTVLFTRSPGGLLPTAAANRLMPYAEAMASMAEAIVRAASTDGDAIAGTVRVTCSEVMAAEVVPALLAPMLADHPALAIELVSSNRNDDLLRRDADIAIRMVRPTQAALIARRIGSVALGLYAHQRYLARRAAPASLADLTADHALIGEDKGKAIVDTLRAHGIDAEGLYFRFRSDSDLAQLAAVRAGIGIGVCQRGIAGAEPHLVPILPQIAVALDLWLVMHEDLRSQAAVRAVYGHLASALGDYCST